QYINELTPDPVTTTQAHLEFLGAGLRVLVQHNQPIPDTFDGLRADLRRRNFATTHRSHTVTSRYTADDELVFQYESAPGDWHDFEMIEPDEPDQPPALVAPHARWRPMLVWERDSEGDL